MVPPSNDCEIGPHQGPTVTALGASRCAKSAAQYWRAQPAWAPRDALIIRTDFSASPTGVGGPQRRGRGPSHFDGYS
jgi:hypothetical protein